MTEGVLAGEEARREVAAHDHRTYPALISGMAE